MNLVGTTIGSYVVEQELGAGGTGTVYRCRHTLIDRPVAIKVLHDDHALDPDMVHRFFREAKSAADIGHPNIVVIIDFGQVQTPGGPRAYLMMEALDGESLDKRLGRGPLSLPDIAHVLRQTCSALVASHTKGIVHRDLKPANVFLCRQVFDPLFVKVLDFGTAKLTQPSPDQRKTQFGMVLGTPQFMSPEQCDGRGDIDHRSDVYSLGMMLYLMLTGGLPFDGDPREILMRQLRELPPPPRAKNPSVPPGWEGLCMNMIAKDREARFQTMEAILAALDDLGELAAEVPTPPPAPRGSAAPAVIRTELAAPAQVMSPNQAARALCGTGFVGALLARLEGRWHDLDEVCRTSGAVAPSVLPAKTKVTWLDHPDANPVYAAVVFLHADTGWSAAITVRRDP